MQPEILDEVADEDPRAQRSRKDFRLINFLMGNERWILRQIDGEEMGELGAGSGELTRQLAARGQVAGLDFQETPQV